jgi:hypothetical protein
MTKAGQKKKGTVGRPKKFSKDQAQKICRMIERMPDAEIPVNWDNVITHVKKSFRITCDRGLSQDEWDGRKLIAEAFSEAKKVQKRMQKDTAPKYKSAPRAVLQKRIMELEAKVLALQEELEKERAQKVYTLDAFLNTRCDLQKLLDQRQERILPMKQVKDDDDIPW